MGKAVIKFKGNYPSRLNEFEGVVFESRDKAFEALVKWSTRHGITRAEDCFYQVTDAELWQIEGFVSEDEYKRYIYHLTH